MVSLNNFTAYCGQLCGLLSCEERSFVECDAVLCDETARTFEMNLLPPYFKATVMTQAGGFLETSVPP